MKARWLFAGFLLVYFCAGVWTTRQIAATGDEPYYFMAADAILRREGFELTTRWSELAEASYATTTPVTLVQFLKQSSPSLVREGRYPLHDPGLSLLIALPFAVGGRGLVVMVSAIAMAGAIALAFRAACAIGIGRRAAIAAAIAAGLAAPAITYSGQTFPDAIASFPVALVICAALGVVPARWAGLGLASLPVLHLRYWPLTLGLIALVILIERPSKRGFGLLVLPLACAFAALTILGLAVYGVPVPHASFATFFLGGEQVSDYSRPSGTGLVGLFADRTFGLLAAAPVFALAIWGAGIAARHRIGRGLVLSAAPYLIAVAFLDWTGAFSPQARYLAPLVPLLVILLGFSLRSRAAWIVAMFLFAFTIVQTAIFIVAPHLRYGEVGVGPLSDLAWDRLGIRPSAIFPILTASSSAIAAALWAVILSAISAIGFFCHPSVTSLDDSPPIWNLRSRPPR